MKNSTQRILVHPSTSTERVFWIRDHLLPGFPTNTPARKAWGIGFLLRTEKILKVLQAFWLHRKFGLAAGSFLVCL